MRKIAVIFSLAAGAFILVNCTPKAGKQMSDTSKTAPAEVATAPPAPATPPAATEPATYTAAQIASGKNIYNDNCGKCHKLYAPETFTATRWVPILKGMIPKAKLNENDATLVRAYVFSNAKQG